MKSKEIEKLVAKWSKTGLLRLVKPENIEEVVVALETAALDTLDAAQKFAKPSKLPIQKGDKGFDELAKIMENTIKTLRKRGLLGT